MAKEKGQGSVFQGVMVLLVLVLCAGGGGFAVGYMQEFAPVKKVAPSGGGEITASSTATGSLNTTSAPRLKKVYWLSTHGYERTGYAVKVYVNGHDVGTFQTPDRQVDITNYLTLGDNKVRFDAKALPEGMRNTEYSSAHFDIRINQGEKYSANGYKNAETLLEYSRKISETENFDDTLDLAIVE